MRVAPGITRRCAPIPAGGPSFAPTDIANCTLWLRADRGLTKTTTVSAWADQSGHGNDFTQATGSKQPLYVASAINGRPGMTFDGVDDLLVGPAMSAVITASTYNLFIVLKPVAIARSNSLSYLNDGVFGDPGGYGICYLDANSGTPQILTGNFVALDASARKNLVATTDAVLYAGRHNGGNIYTAINSGTEASSASGNTGSLTGLLSIAGGLSATSYGNFIVSEIIAYSVDLDTQNAGDYARVRNYLKADYGTP